MRPEFAAGLISRLQNKAVRPRVSRLPVDHQARDLIRSLGGALRAMPWTGGLITALLLMGLAIVISQPRPRAMGLGRLLVTADLLQSFPIDSNQPVPELWSQRLGPSARSIWRRSSGSWWQLWAGHDDAGASLVIPAASLRGSLRPNEALAVDELLVIAPDRLAAAELTQLLRRSPRELQGLEQRCLQRLEQGQAVYWSSRGLAGVFGPLSPLIQHWQQGCLSLQLGADRLGWDGEASGIPGLKQQAPTPLPPAAGLRELPDGTLLAIHGGRLDLLLGSLLGRSLVRDALQETYGLDPDTTAKLAGSPFALSLRSLPQGPFRLALALEVNTAEQRQTWLRALQRLDQGIRRQGLQSSDRSPRSTAMARPTSRDVLWRRDDGVVVGGWRWRRPPGGTPDASPEGGSQVVLFLGPPPAPAFLPAVPGRHPQEPGQLEVLMNPRALAAEKVMPSGLPPLLQTAARLQIRTAGRGPGGRAGMISPLQGELQLQP